MEIPLDEKKELGNCSTFLKLFAQFRFEKSIKTLVVSNVFLPPPSRWSSYWTEGFHWHAWPAWKARVVDYSWGLPYPRSFPFHLGVDNFSGLFLVYKNIHRCKSIF